MANALTLSWARGAELPPRPDLPETLLEGIHKRLDQSPLARLWTVDSLGLPTHVFYRDLWPRAARIAEGLASNGLEQGEVVAILAGSVPDVVAVFWACLMGGYTILPLSGRARRAREMGQFHALNAVIDQLPGARILADVENRKLAQVLSGERALDLAHIEELGAGEPRRAAAAANPVCWLPTSGSTGRDKLAGLSEATLLARRFHRSNSNTTPGDVQMWISDPDSVNGLNAAFVHSPDWVQVSPTQVLARPDLVLDLAERLKVRSLALTSSLARLVAQVTESTLHIRNLSALDRVTMGAETVDPKVARRLTEAFRRHDAAGVQISAGYGTTETGMLVTGARITPHAPADGAALILGHPAAGVELRIVGDDGGLLPEGETGAVEARCPGMMFSRYVHATGRAAGFCTDGWWQTGDLGRLEGGRLSLHGRLSQVVAIHGRKLALDDIESALASAVGDGRRAVACRLAIEEGEQFGVMVYGPPEPGLQGAVRRLIGERFGVQPAHIGFAAMEALPLGPTGKLLRLQVAQMLAEVAAPLIEAQVGSADLDDRLHALWRECLPQGAEISPDSHFFADGGDSLAAQHLFAGVEEQFGLDLRTSAFFTDPTLRHLAELVRDEAPQKVVALAMNWALPSELHQTLMAKLENWPGERPTQDLLMAGLNTAGRLPPLFWVFQIEQEFTALAAQLGPDQPLYGFRSGHGVYSYDEDILQLVALRYVQDVLAVCPDGPLFIGGNCQGGRVALVMAQHLLRRQIQLPLLILMEWGFELTAYVGDVLFLHGHSSLEGNPWLRHAEPEQAWRRLLRRVETAAIPGSHGMYFLPANAPGLATVLAKNMAEAGARPPVMLPELARRADIQVRAAPERMTGGQRQSLQVTVRNLGRMTWPCGLSLGNYWLNAGGGTVQWRDGRVTAPALKPDEAVELLLDVTAPEAPGDYQLKIDMVEEGGSWFDRKHQILPTLRIRVS